MNKYKIGDLFNIEKGSLQSSKNTPGMYDFITASAEWKTHESYTHDCEALVFAMGASGSLGRTHYVNGKFIASDLCFILTPKNEYKDKLNLKLYYFYFNYHRKEIVKNTATGTSKLSINMRNFSNYEIDFVENQNEVVKIVEKSDLKVNQLNKLINENELLLSNLKKKIVEEAVRGQLTKSHYSSTSTSEMLKEMKEEIKQKVKGKLISKPKAVAPLTTEEKNRDIPSNWEYVRLTEVAMINPRNSLDDELEVSFIPMKLIEDGFKSEHSSEVKKWKEIKSGFTHFKENDVVIAKITPCFENRKSAIMKNLINGYGAGTTELYVVRPYTKHVLPEFLLIIFKTEEFISKGVDTYTGTAGQQRIKKDFIENFVFGLPPLEEQKLIIKKVNKLIDYCYFLEEQVKEMKNQLEQLMKLIMDNVFNKQDKVG